jgi:hypothetical protein
MKRTCLALLPLAAAIYSTPIFAAPATYYVRTGGASPAYCNGTADVDYSIAVAPNCAWASPLYALPPNLDANDVGRKPLMNGGDTLYIRAGQYQMGLPFNGGSWGSCKPAANGQGWPYDCHMQPVPSGTAAQHTRIIGAGSKLTQLWGSGGAAFVLNLTGSSYVDVSGLEITDHSNCIQKQPDTALTCQDNGLWAAVGISDTAGGTDTPQSSFVTLNDINIHGMAKYGVWAGDINNWTVSNVQIIGNGWGGWSLDTGPSYSRGINAFSNMEIGWNGCTENYPTTAIWGCWGQSTGGYGDGFGSSSASDQGTWTFSQINVHNNTQDGLDFLHASPLASVSFDHVTAKNNAGNQLKANGTASITYSVVVGDCGSFAGVGDMVGNNSNSGNSSGDICRAQGDPVQMGQTPGLTTLLDHDTIISQGNTLVTVPSTGYGDKTSVLKLTNNILIGSPRWIQNDGSIPAIWWWVDSSGNPVSSPLMSGNVFFDINYGTCPSGNICTDPQLTNEKIATFDATPTAATPPNVGAIQNTVSPPPVACSGGIVSAGACYCPVGTTLLSGACGPLPAQCKPVAVCTNTATSMSCSGACQQ